MTALGAPESSRPVVAALAVCTRSGERQTRLASSAEPAGASPPLAGVSKTVTSIGVSISPFRSTASSRCASWISGTGVPGAASSTWISTGRGTAADLAIRSSGWG